MDDDDVSRLVAFGGGGGGGGGAAAAAGGAVAVVVFLGNAGAASAAAACFLLFLLLDKDMALKMACWRLKISSAMASVGSTAVAAASWLLVMVVVSFFRVPPASLCDAAGTFISVAAPACVGGLVGACGCCPGCGLVETANEAEVAVVVAETADF